MSQSAVFHLVFTVAPLLFTALLFLLPAASEKEKKQKYSPFRILVIASIAGMALACIDGFVRRDHAVSVSVMEALACGILTYICNIFIFYRLAAFTETLPGISPPAPARKANLAVMILAAGFAVFGFINFSGSDTAALPFWFRLTAGYAAELYFLVYSAALLLFRRSPECVQHRFVLTACGVTAAGLLLGISGLCGLDFTPAGLVFGLYLIYIGSLTAEKKALEGTVSGLEGTVGELKTAVAGLEESRRQAEDANRFKSAFLADVSYEIRSPMNTVLGMNEMILRESSDQNIISYAKAIETAGAQLLSSINNILDLPKVGSGAIKAQSVPYKLRSLLDQVIKTAAPKISEKELDFSIAVDRLLPATLSGDKGLICRVLENIFDYAVGHTDSGSLKLSVKGAACAEAGAETIMLEITLLVTDIGMREEDIPGLLESAGAPENADGSRSPAPGLSLSISRRILRMMDGSLDINSSYGKGTAFKVKLPQKAETSEPIGEYHSPHKKRAKGGRSEGALTAPGVSILVVDDMPVNLLVVKKLLKKTEISIDTAKSGQEALIQTSEKKYDLIIMDQVMPQMDGTQTMRKIRTQSGGLNAETPVVCFTADTAADPREKFLKEGFADYLAKPVSGRDIENVLRLHLPKEKITS